MTSDGAGGYGQPQPGRYGEPQQGPPVTSTSHAYPPQNQYPGQQAPQGQYPGQQAPRSPYTGEQPPQQPPAPSRTTSPLVWAGVGLTTLLGVAALVISLTGVSGGSMSTASSPSSSTQMAAPASEDTSEADRALCQDIAPLLKESLKAGKDFVNLGFPGTPERDGGIPAFKEKVDTWVTYVQPVLDRHANPPRYLTRMTQMFIDFTKAYADNIRPGPEPDVDKVNWNMRVVAFGGPFDGCQKFGVTW